MLGFDISERTISRWMKRAQRNAEPARRWLAFLRNHREAIAAMDFLTVPTITFGLLYCFSIIGHGQSAPRFLIFDRDAKYGLEVPIAVRSMAIRPVRTSFQSLWQNGIAERWVESCRRDLLDHVIAFNEHHLKRLLSDYVRYYHEDRKHLGLKKETPANRVRSTDRGTVVSQARLGGLHHRYDRADL